MPAYKDKNTNNWYAFFFATDWMGNRKRIKKRGFKTKREALQYEREYLSEPAKNEDLIFKKLYILYIADIEGKYKESTLETKKNIYEKYILPYFKKKKIADITAANIRMWQNEIRKENLSDTYTKSINSQMSAIMNYAVRYYGLPSNPCRIAGSMGKKRSGEMKFWTLEEYNCFIQFIDDPRYHVAFDLLFWGGIRKGELLALTPADINDNAININKTASWINKRLVVTEPKTENSKRTVTLPPKIIDELTTYINALYGIQYTDRIFDFASNHTLNGYLNKICKQYGITPIRIHDLRHSHAALCIDMGYNMFEISKRLGHQDIKITMNTYGHLYPNKQIDIANSLDEKIGDFDIKY